MKNERSVAMPRLNRITDEEASPELRAVFDGARSMLGFVSNSTRTIAHSPWVVKWLTPFTAAIQRESGGILDARTKELAVIRTSVVNTCQFCLGHNRELGKIGGLTAAQVAAVEGDYENSPELTAKEKCVVRWAELVTKNTAKYDKACWEELKTYFSAQEIVELTMVICHFNLLNRINDSLHLDLEVPPPSMKTLKVSTDRFATYAQQVLSHVGQA
jgi:uncharacterized peroxidase-related enzyme